MTESLRRVRDDGNRINGDGCEANCTLPTPCVGDCNGDQAVQVDELIMAVNIALGTADHSACESVDADGNGSCDIDELLLAVSHALSGCSE